MLRAASLLRARPPPPPPPGLAALEGEASLELRPHPEPSWEGAEAIELMTAFSESAGNRLVQDWLALWKRLFFRFRDQFTISAPPHTGHPKAPPRPSPPPSLDGAPQDHPWPTVEEQGYPAAWYAHIVAATGERYLVPDHLHTQPRGKGAEERKRRVLGL